MPQIAAMLNVSPRTYRRRLAAGHQLPGDSRQVRAEHATRHLREGRLPIASIAYQLGFNDPSNFRRAYRRWTGHTPGEVRRAARPRGQPAP
jgi:AraC-like DNA-binding protein